MKKLFHSPFIVPSLIFVTLFQLSLIIILFYQINRSINQQTQSLNDTNSIISLLATSTDNNITNAINKLREELANSPISHQTLGTTTNNNNYIDMENNPNSTPSSNPHQTTNTTDTHIESNTTKMIIVKLKSNWGSAEVFELPRSGSKIVGQIIANQHYLADLKQNNWYQIKLNTNLPAWVQSQFVDEIAY